jgi:hypothetical protein
VQQVDTAVMNALGLYLGSALFTSQLIILTEGFLSAPLSQFLHANAKSVP